jgi:Flp pilus assembly pilin Flp
VTEILASIRDFVRGEEGVSLVEYALTLLLLLIVTMTAISAVGSSLSAFFIGASSSI